MTREELEFSISQYVDGTLDDQQRRGVEAVLAADPEARKLLEQEQAVTSMLRTMPMPQVRWDALADSISQAIDDDMAQRVERASMRIRVRWSAAAVAIAAMVLLACGLAFQWMSRSATSTANSVAKIEPAPSVSPVALITIQGPQEEVSAAPAVAEISIGAGGAYASNSSAAYADEMDGRPARVVIASACSPTADRPRVGFPY